MTMLYEDFPLGGPGYDFLAMKARVQALAGAELAEALKDGCMDGSLYPLRRPSRQWASPFLASP